MEKIYYNKDVQVTMYKLYCVANKLFVSPREWHRAAIFVVHGYEHRENCSSSKINEQRDL